MGYKKSIPVAITTAPRKGVEYLDETLISLVNAGWEDVLVVAEPEAPVNGHPRVLWNRNRLWAWANFLNALAVLIEEDPASDALMVCQDDIRIAKDTRRWLEAQLWPSEDTGVLSLYTCSATAAGKDEGWFRLGDADLPERAFGALAIVMPTEAAAKLLCDPPGRDSRNRIDYHLGEFCAQHRLGYWQHMPSLVRHVGKVSSFVGYERPKPRRWIPGRREGPCVDDVAELGT